MSIKGRKWSLYLTSSYLQGLTLEALLIQPIQRLPRYVMLVTDLLKRTEESHPDHANLSKARELLQVEERRARERGRQRKF
tara:strand:- start:2625 stop:2867 length:243 start_codon:yes stop_codon:yes gene_type:complete